MTILSTMMVLTRRQLDSSRTQTHGTQQVLVAGQDWGLGSD